MVLSRSREVAVPRGRERISASERLVVHDWTLVVGSAEPATIRSIAASVHRA